MRWRGALPDGSGLQECAASMRSVRREGEQSTGTLRQAGLPATLRRQLLVPVVDGSRIIGVVLLGNKAESYDEDDQRQALNVSEGLWKVLRRRRSDAEVVSAMDHMERVMLGAIESLATLSEAQDGCKTGRARRVAELPAAWRRPGPAGPHGARPAGHGAADRRGMLQIPREILWRRGQLTPAEFELVKTHTERGFDSLRRIEFPWPVAEVVRQHHERMDGSGYPRGLRGEDILLEARIVAVADAVEAMMSQRRSARRSRSPPVSRSSRRRPVGAMTRRSSRRARSCCATARTRGPRSRRASASPDDGPDSVHLYDFPLAATLSRW